MLAASSTLRRLSSSDIRDRILRATRWLVSQEPEDGVYFHNDSVGLYNGVVDSNTRNTFYPEKPLGVLLTELTQKSGPQELIIPLAYTGLRNHWTLLHLRINKQVTANLYDSKGGFLARFWPTGHIQQIIANAFPHKKIVFKVHYLANQSVGNTYDCGRWVALYASELIQTGVISKPYQFNNYDGSRSTRTPLAWFLQNHGVRLVLLILISGAIFVAGVPMVASLGLYYSAALLALAATSLLFFDIFIQQGLNLFMRVTYRLGYSELQQAVRREPQLVLPQDLGAVTAQPTSSSVVADVFTVVPIPNKQL